MSIPNLIYKIKSKTGVDQITIIYLLIIIGVGIGSFGLGRISKESKEPIKGDISTIQKVDYFNDENIEEGNIEDISQTQTLEKKYVASKNGKMYYSLGCSGAKRIKSENEVWFSTKSDAEKSGYTLSSTCK